MNRITTETLLQDFKSIHGDKFNYDKMEYKSYNEKVVVGCKIHGDVYITAHGHKTTNGCPDCGRLIRKKSGLVDFKLFVQRARERHGDKYQYVESSYSGLHRKVSILCKEHGEFLQQAASHCNISGCPACGLKIIGNAKRYDQNKFLEVAAKRHPNLDFSEVEYRDRFTQIKVTCREHGEFTTLAGNILVGVGCIKCGFSAKCAALTHSFSDFLIKAEKVHGNSYDYSISDYRKTKTHINIVCKACKRVFLQTPHNHIAGKHGCSYCSATGYNKGIQGNLYILGDCNITKIGITNREVSKRLRQVNNASGLNFKEINRYRLEGQICYEVEQSILRYLRSNFKSIEKKFDGSTECFLDVDIPTILIAIEKAIASYGI